MRRCAHTLTQDETGWTGPPPLLDNRVSTSGLISYRRRMAAPELIASCLASAFVSGRWEVKDLVDRGQEVLGRRWRWLRPLAERVVREFGPDRRPSQNRVLRFLQQDVRFRRSCERHEIQLHPVQRQPPVMAPAAGSPQQWDLPSVVTVGQLADWLELPIDQLDWFVDRRGWESREVFGPLRHYRYQWLSKRRAGRARLIEAPKWRLKRIQRRILRDILDRIPVHGSAHGFRRDRSILSYVAPHAGQDIVIRMDLHDFFPSVPKPRVVALFRVVGYPEEVAQCLGALCTNAVPPDVRRTFPQYGDPRDRWYHERLYCVPHLPQGAPTSPAVANLCCHRLDCRLSGLANSIGAKYTRYADDMLFSGGQSLACAVSRFRATVCAIAGEEGFRIHSRKTRVMRQGVRQTAAGLVINRHINLGRVEFDQLKAILTNCIRRGPASQNRETRPDFRAHLQGRVAFVESVNPARGRKLRRLLDQISWLEE